jgi:hypothetical protein
VDGAGKPSPTAEKNGIGTGSEVVEEPDDVGEVHMVVRVADDYV